MKSKLKEHKGLVGLVCAVAVGLVLGVIVSKTLFRMVKVDGVSMEPTYKDSETILMKEIGGYSKGDIVVFNHGKDILIKRLIAEPGDTIQIKDSTLFINGEEVKEDYIKEWHYAPGIAQSEIALGEDEYFVMGDNRNHSKDSRAFGPIKSSDIIGTKAF